MWKTLTAFAFTMLVGSVVLITLLVFSIVLPARAEVRALAFLFAAWTYLAFHVRLMRARALKTTGDHVPASGVTTGSAFAAALLAFVAFAIAAMNG
jgi:hypothetical protein